MAINEVIFPKVPNPVSGDWALAIELIEKAYQNVTIPLQIDGSNNIPQGATFQVGAHVYYADSDTAITGTPSDYVKLTVTGTTLVPSYVATLSGVTWNKIYNGYYDISGDYYIFNEFQAYTKGEVTSLETKDGLLAMANRGKADITLSEYDTTSAPQVQSGSIFENRGKLIEVTTDVTPTGYSGISISTTFYIYWDESAGVFIYSSTVPTWSDALQGWYNGNDRAFFSMYKDSGGTLYELKTKLQDQNNINIGNIETLDSGVSWTVPANVYRVKATIIAAGGGGGSSSVGLGATGGNTTFNGITATGGLGGKAGTDNTDARSASNGFISSNGGVGASNGGTDDTGESGYGGQIKIQLFNFTPSSNISYSIGSGGTGGTGGTVGGAGGTGQIILEY